MGLDTEELYIQGFSSSMPEEVQIEMLHSVKGLEHAEIMRPAYAIEYDCIDPTALYPTLEYKHIEGLYGAGQFNGSSGYEEAAVQGFVAGVNAARKLKGETPFILGREQAYIGTLIDDLVTKGTNEPYRMMTSRSEYRLILRQDNADERLAPIGHELGLVSDETLQKVNDKYDAVRREIKRLEHTGVGASDALNALLSARGTAEVRDGSPLIALLRRPQLTYDDLRDFDAGCRAFPPALAESVEIAVKYEGYIRRQMAEVAEFARLERRAIPADIDYARTPQIVLGLDDPTSHEAYGGGAIKFDEDGMQNNHFTRYYLAATKHFCFAGVGTLGVHAAYVDYRACWFPHYRRPAAGVNFKFNLLPEDNLAVKALNGLDLMAEYDARTVNIGAHYQLWKDHINLIAELNNGKYFSGGIYFKIHLK